VPIEWQLSFPPECGDKGLAALRAFEFGADIGTEFGEIPGTETRQLMMLLVSLETFERFSMVTLYVGFLCRSGLGCSLTLPPLWSSSASDISMIQIR
jgi:hypothetical protein